MFYKVIFPVFITCPPCVLTRLKEPWVEAGLISRLTQKLMTPQ